MKLGKVGAEAIAIAPMTTLSPRQMPYSPISGRMAAAIAKASLAVMTPLQNADLDFGDVVRFPDPVDPLLVPASSVRGRLTRRVLHIGALMWALRPVGLIVLVVGPLLLLVAGEMIRSRPPSATSSRVHGRAVAG